ncbi:MAG: shikimate dehydrogenase [Flavobacteriales bacterium]|nr:shikimate dehydrogenase [Flavobacteriales bacterium]
MKLFGLVGYPLAHSFSAAWFAKKFADTGQSDCEYRLIEVPDVSQLTTALAIENLHGFNVTIPYKQAIIPLLRSISDDARAIGAVNCVRVDSDGGWIGVNTDAPAFSRTLRPFLTQQHQRALVLGNGGASAAVCFVLRQLGIEVVVIGRQEKAGIRRYDELTPEAIAHFKLIVNTTPVGQFPNAGELPAIPTATIGPDHLVYDLVYNPAPTRLLEVAAARGATTLNGLEMLHLQAELSWKTWFEAPL